MDAVWDTPIAVELRPPVLFPQVHTGYRDFRLVTYATVIALNRTGEDDLLDWILVNGKTFLRLNALLHISSRCNRLVTYATVIALNRKGEDDLLDWILVNGRLCTVRWSGSIKINVIRCGKQWLFVVSVYTPTDGSNETENDRVYRDQSRLLRSARRMSGVNAQVSRPIAEEAHDQCTENGAGTTSVS
ncbi:hypothetical protein T265_03007 [Opisthorchis viverrini]|uniref:Uncharacterized protein n=1 Tax=Opisthorchis viverrini TaxID=6198 RepID=A0A075A525_OPIVI|nr:hypothetical protein T265_03007 [Opisthorchis viverrini]KER30660.1 hypothetical protein T265_03007 [Opisthorchis viverrini]